MILQDETMIQTVRRAFPEAQRLLAGAPADVGRVLEVGWHHTDTNPETGAAAVVRRGGPLEDWLGSVLLVRRMGGTGADLVVAQAFVYVVGVADVVADLSLARRAFFAISPLAFTRQTVTAAVV